MKTKMKLLTSMAALLFALPLVGCDNTSNSRWHLSDEDYENIVEGEAILTQPATHSYQYDIVYIEPLVSKTITENDFRIIDETKVSDEVKSESYGSDYMNEALLNKYSISPTKIECSEDLTHITINFTYDTTSDFAILINKDVTVCEQFIVLETYEEPAEIIYDDPEVIYEKKYASEAFTWNNAGGFIVNILNNISAMGISAYTGNVGSFVGGMFSLLSNLGNKFLSDTNTKMADMINEMNSKLDEISANMTRNFNQLKEEAIKTELGVNETIVLEHQQAISTFNTNYVYQIDAFNTAYSNTVATYLTDIVNGGQKDLDMWFGKDDDEKYVLSSIVNVDEDEMVNVDVSISDFSNSLAFLKKNNQTVKNGFMDALKEDIKAATTYVTLPEGMTMDELNESAYANFMETCSQKYFVDNPTKATELQILVENESKALYGEGIGAKSVMDDYLQRFQYMYNFAGEVKTVLTTVVAELLNQLDAAAAWAGLGLSYCHLDTDQLETRYRTAREYIQAEYNSFDKVKDNYSFDATDTITGNFYSLAYCPTYSNRGNHPNLSVTQDFRRYYKDSNYFCNYAKESLSDHNWMDSLSLRRIAVRMGLLKNLGLVKVETDFITYLHDNKAITDDGMYAYKFYNPTINTKDSNNDYRIFTGITNSRSLRNEDSSLSMIVYDKGNPGGDYFSIGRVLNYKSKEDSDCWSGQIYETEYIDGTTGAIRSETMLGAWATYAESHWYWRNDEYYSFVALNHYGSKSAFFFGISLD